MDGGRAVCLVVAQAAQPLCSSAPHTEGQGAACMWLGRALPSPRPSLPWRTSTARSAAGIRAVLTSKGIRANARPVSESRQFLQLAGKGGAGNSHHVWGEHDHLAGAGTGLHWQ